MSEQKKFSPFGFFIWAIVLLFYFYEFFVRVLPATAADQIIHSLDMSLEQFGIIGSAYYITYSFMQIPVGILLDRFSARVLITVASGLCAFGALWFGFAYEFFPAFVSRLLIGLGSSFGFVALLITTLNWFPKKHFAFLIGCGLFLGSIGPLVAGGPIAYVLKAVDGNWRVIFLWSAVFGFALTALILLFFQGKPTQNEKVIFVDVKDPLGKRLKTLLVRQQVWWVLLYGGMIYVTLPILGAFWGTSYLQTRGLPKTSAASVISMIWIGLAIGSPLFGKLSDRMKRRKPFVSLCAVIGVAGSLLFLFAPIENVYILSGLFFLIGLSGGGQTLAFALISEQAPTAVRATAMGLTNTAVMGTAAILGPFVTSIIRHFTIDGQVSEAAFEKGFLVLPICYSIALLVALFGLKETFCREQTEVHQVHSSYPTGF